MNFKCKFFAQLSTAELYEILKARVNIFVVEQNCPYPELDGIDYDCLHIYYEDCGRVLAYLRAFVKEKGTVQMGRVLTVERGIGLGGALLKEAIRLIRESFDAEKIYIEAQSYAIGFYEREGFNVCSEEFLEDSIPYVKMELLL